MMVIPSEGRRPVDLALRGVTDISKSGVYRTLTSGALPLSGQLSFTATSHPCTLSMCCLEHLPQSSGQKCSSELSR